MAVNSVEMLAVWMDMHVVELTAVKSAEKMEVLLDLILAVSMAVL